MEKPVLLVMAAGMGSRYGGLKQIDPVGENGEIIIDYSLYDAKLAGFEKVVFIIKEENKREFEEIILPRAGKNMEVEFVYQSVDDIPSGFSFPADRVKPWGTGHAVLCAAKAINTPFAVINADDFYGREAFEKIYNFLESAKDDDKCHYSMVGFYLENTITENGFVSRGVCEVDNGNLKKVTERTRIEKHDNIIEYSEDEGKTWTVLDKGTTVSMNLWGFTPSVFNYLDQSFKEFLAADVVKNPLKAEFYLPFVVDEMIQKDKADVEVLSSGDKWYGVTYKEDRMQIINAVKEMVASGKYPKKLW